MFTVMESEHKTRKFVLNLLAEKGYLKKIEIEDENTGQASLSFPIFFVQGQRLIPNINLNNLVGLKELQKLCEGCWDITVDLKITAIEKKPK